MKKNRLIIGNGPSVLNRTLGEEIDAFDTVVRIGKYSIKGFEKHVGSKTDYWFSLTNDHTIKPGVKKIQCKLSAKKLESSNPEGEEYIPKNAIQFAYDYAGITKKSGIRPTLGLLTIAHCLLVFKWENVKILGFDHFDPDRKKHYWWPETRIKTICQYHDPVCERRFTEALISEGKIERI